MKKYDIDDNQALVHEVKCRRAEGESFDDVAEGVGKQAIEQLTEEAVCRLKQLTEPVE
jgi:hypothetical protein